MTDKDFANRLDRLGSDLSVWPAADRRKAEALLASSPQARAALHRAEDLDRLLRQAAAVPVIDERRIARVMAATMTAIAAQEPKTSPFARLIDRLSGGWMPQLGTAALFGMLGILAGLMSEQQPVAVNTAALPDLLMTASSLEGLLQ